METHIKIEDMASPFTIHREQLLLLCDAGVLGELPPDAITAIAFMLIASDHFEWDGDELISAVLSDWSAPEVNYPINPSTLRMYQRWLLGTETPPARPSQSSERGRLVSVRRKVH